MNQTKERPILFTGEMAKAILENKKRQTRRVVKKPKRSPMSDEMFFAGLELGVKDRAEVQNCPYGQPGERLWVKETFAPYGDAGALWFKAGIPEYECARPTGKWLNFPYLLGELVAPSNNLKWTPSIFMPRWASRITLEITGVRVERVQDISEEDAKAEGVVSWTLPTGEKVYKPEFSLLWKRINDKRPGCSWQDNPWVFVIEFKRIEAKL